MQAAIGVAQLDKIHDFVSKRRRNFNLLKEALSMACDKLWLPEACPDSNPSWFGFLITCRSDINRNKLVRQLEEDGIQTRMLFAGNIVRQPCISSSLEEGIDYRIVGSLTETDRIMNDTFWVGVYPGLNEQAVGYIADSIKRYL
jgi:CDP-6-deoxy-D-xylo-4-hexulose-3-dehydrase